MLGFGKRDAAVQTLRDENDALNAELTALMTQVAVLSSRVDAGMEQQAAAMAERSHLIDRLALQERALAEQALAIDAQAKALTALTGSEEHQRETANRLRADFARLERQAARDLDELRSTNAAIAATIFGSARAGQEATKVRNPT